MRTNNNWIQTYTGRQFWPLDPAPEDVDIRDIAHALSQKCRYTGHSLVYYSVAQHCVLMSLAVPKEFAKWALLHDAGEAYLPDVARPIKKELAGFVDIENRVLTCIAEKFGLVPEMPEVIKEADIRMLATEKLYVMADVGLNWGLEDIRPYEFFLESWDCEKAEAEYLFRYNELWMSTKAGQAVRAGEVIDAEIQD